MVSAPTSSHSGRQLRPRVDHQPPGIAFSYGPAACELAELAGWRLDSWQADELDLILSVHEDGLWACRDYDLTVARQQGKTARVAAPRALAGLLLLGEEELFWSAHEVKTVLDSHRAMTFAFRRLGEVINPNLVLLDGGPEGDIYVKIINNNGFEGFELTRPALPPGSMFPPAQRLRFIARSKGSGRGMSGDCNINDEAFAINDEQTDALAPTQLARANPQDLYFSSPPLDGRSGAVLFDLRTRARKGDPRLGFRDYGLAKTLDEIEEMEPEERAAFLDNRDNWHAALPAVAAGRVPERSIEAMRRKMKDRGFAREILGCWPVQIGVAGIWQVVSEDAWLSRGGLSKADRIEGELVLAVAAAHPDAEHGALAVAGRRDDEIAVQILAHRRGTSWLVNEVRGLVDRNDVAAVVLDRKGPARHLIPDFEKAGIELTHPSMDDVAQAAATFYAEVAGDEPAVRHYDQTELDDALSVAQKRPLGDGWAWMRKGVTDISPLEAATFAVWGVTSVAAPEPWAVWV